MDASDEPLPLLVLHPRAAIAPTTMKRARLCLVLSLGELEDGTAMLPRVACQPTSEVRPRRLFRRHVTSARGVVAASEHEGAMAGQLLRSASDSTICGNPASHFGRQIPLLRKTCCECEIFAEGV